MFLLDHNFPIQILEFLQSEKTQVQTTRYHGWEALENGALAASAYQFGYRCILTRDKKFAESAARALKQFPELSIVVVTLKQDKAARYLEAFCAAWIKNRILVQSGQLLRWPE